MLPVNAHLYSQYKVTSNPTGLFVDLATVKTHLRLSASDTSQDAYLTLLIKAATAFGEKYTRRVFINTNFLTYRDTFYELIELRKSPFAALISYKYLKDGGFIDVPSDLYYISDEVDYSKIILKCGKSYPDDIDCHDQSVKIEFTAGFSAAAINIYDSIKSDLILAVLNHIATLYENRGDCDDAALVSNLPNSSKIIYGQHKIYSLIGDLEKHQQYHLYGTFY